jgi:hypothetical protein
LAGFGVEIPGHVDANGELILTADGAPRDDVTIGIQEDYDPLNAEPLRLEAADLEELAGTLVGENIEGTTSPDWVALAGSGEQPHTGMWRVYAWVEVEANSANTVDSLVRLSYRSAGGRFTYTDRPVWTRTWPATSSSLTSAWSTSVRTRGLDKWSSRPRQRGSTSSCASFNSCRRAGSPGCGLPPSCRCRRP